MFHNFSYEVYNLFFRLSKKYTLITSSSILIELIEEDNKYLKYLIKDFDNHKAYLINYILECNFKETLSKIKFNNTPLTQEVIDIITKANEVINIKRVNSIEIEHIILSMIELDRSNVNELLKHFIKEIDEIKEESEDNILIDLTKTIDNSNILERCQELNKIEIILNRYKKRNVLIIGESGVGKTELVYQLVRNYRIEKPKIKVYELNISSLLSNTKYRGDLECRLDMVFEKIEKEKAILYIDEIHLLFKSNDNDINIANYLKLKITSSINLIASTTSQEYTMYIYKDSAFLRRFSLIKLKEPSLTETINILNNIKASYSLHYNYQYGISKSMIEYMVKCSRRLTKQNFPDKAIDVLDMVLSKCSIKKTKVTKKEIDKTIYDICQIPKCKLDYEVFNLSSSEIDYIELTNEEIEKLKEEIVKATNLTKDLIFDIDISKMNSINIISDLFGSSKGYIGYTDGGLFSNYLKETYFGLVILRNIDECYVLSEKIKEGVKLKYIVDNQNNKLSLINKIIITTKKNDKIMGFAQNF